MKRRAEEDDAGSSQSLKKTRLGSVDDQAEAGAAGPDREPETSSPSQAHTASHLLSLLDFTSTTTREAISTRFDAIATELLHHFRLRIGSSSVSNADAAPVYTDYDYDILELEFYLHAPGCHEDSFTHGSDEQRRSGRWYFHRSHHALQGKSKSGAPKRPSAAGGYRGGTRKGLDLTLGGPVEDASELVPAQLRASRFFDAPDPAVHSSPSKSSQPQPAAPAPMSAVDAPHGGILLRTLRRVRDGHIVSGPSLLVDEVLRASGAPSVVQLVQTLWGGDTSALRTRTADAVMFLHPVSAADRHEDTDVDEGEQGGEGEGTGTGTGTHPRIYRSPRIGLDLSHASVPLRGTLAHPRAAFVDRPYRYFTRPHLLTANGRGHTFLGVYRALASTPDITRRGSDAAVLADVVRLTGLRHDLAERYLCEYRAAREGGVLGAFVGTKGKGAGSAPLSLLRMVGALERARAVSGD